MRPALLSAIALATLALAARPAAAQIDSSLFSAEWEPGVYWARTLDKLALVPAADADSPAAASDREVSAFYWDSSGRIRLDRHDTDPNPPFVLGYRFLTLGIHGNDDIDAGSPPIGTNGILGVPDDLNDLAIVGAYEFGGSVESEWRIGILAGVGTANDGHWTNSDAIYGIAAAGFARQLDADRSLHLGVGYNGNRTYLHNVPLPIVRFDDRINRDFSYSVGFPTCAFNWQPMDELTIDGEWTLWSRVRLGASFALNQRWSVFVEYEDTADAFFINDDAVAGDDRLFYEFSRAMAGVRWKSKWVDAQLGLGWAFGQDLSVGDEINDADGFDGDIDGGMMVMLNLRGTF